MPTNAHQRDAELQPDASSPSGRVSSADDPGACSMTLDELHAEVDHQISVRILGPGLARRARTLTEAHRELERVELRDDRKPLTSDHE